jgi:hypothetical protein
LDNVLIDSSKVHILNLLINQDSIKTVNNRSSTEVLDYIGDVGGFMVIIDFLSFLGFYFSSKMFIASLAKKLYLLKKPGSDSDKQDEMDKDKILDSNDEKEKFKSTDY